MKTIRFFAVNLLFIMLATIFVGCEGEESTRIIGEWKLVKETYTYDGETETNVGTAPYVIWQFNEDGTYCSYAEDETNEEHIYMPYLLEGEQITIGEQITNDGEIFLLKIQKLSKSQLILDCFTGDGTTYLLYFERYN